MYIESIQCTSLIMNVYCSLVICSFKSGDVHSTRTALYSYLVKTNNDYFVYRLTNLFFFLVCVTTYVFYADINCFADSEEASIFPCSICKRVYKRKTSLYNHQRWECGKEPQFKCSYCPYRGKQKIHFIMHLLARHKDHKMEFAPILSNRKSTE